MDCLTRGSLRKILDGANVNEPILQIQSLKNINGNDGTVRYKISLYDGEMQHTFGILATQKNSYVETGELKVGSVVKLEEYAANVLSKDPLKVVIILLNFEILDEMAQKAVADQQASTMTSSKPVQNENVEPAKHHYEPKPAPASNAKSFFNNKETNSSANKQVNNAPPSSGAPGTFNGHKVFGISNLNPYQNKWSIKVRVTNKSAIRKWSNAKGEGKLFSVDLIDQTGEIRASGFNEQCDKFYDLLQVDNVYYISRAALKPANRQYNTLKNEFEMSFTNETVIEQCQESDDLPHMNFELVPLSELTNKNPNDLVDVIAIVKSSGDVTTIVTKATNKELKKRELHLVDNSNCAVNCTLWGKQAEDFDCNENPVILLKGAKLSDYGGRSMSVLGSTVVQINPDIPEAHAIRGWFDQGGSTAQVHDLSNQTGGGSQGGGAAGAGSMQTSWKTLDQVKDDKLGMGDKADYFSTKSIVLYSKKDNSMYMACPGDNCNKKVVDQNDGTYRCEKCSKNYDNFHWRLILSANIADYTDSNWVTCFQEAAEKILGTTAEELGNLKQTDNQSYDEIFSNCVFKEFNFKVRAKMETYNDERRVKLSVVAIDPVDYIANSKRLLQKIKLYQRNQI